ncbi:YbhB/YbcL family Raf kinase inhibitor-like protein [Streptantibioticus ferralitis]|uniref:YbhB/YbcL family Raf kinase inhibitor-like protein n=1 Tax=Streptantibioticus ferralitis TaxID=236510 RepID=A0ABT5Z4A3_9ACTN|nr:YbhB/YbcL family Raf kinase inhibitor-like protein [Streptantibioticus ferralitis]MDF2258534.1 YbhB/YbcL family Raf kinase inhibitor-like protein [Streptantibioticus ferralitis]
MRGHRIRAGVAVTTALLACASCSGTTKPASDTSASATAPARTTATPTGPLTLTPGQGFDRSGDFIPLMTCDDPRDYSPGLNFANVPAGTAELAVTMVDLDVHKIHWLQLGIPPNATKIAPHHLIPGAREALNDFGEATYDGPCPPHGSTHRYQLTLYALRQPTPASLGGSAPPAQTLRGIQSQAISSASFVARYTRH